MNSFEKIQLPRPTGSYNVALSTHLLKDMSRHYKDEKGRPLLVHLYYPTVKTTKEYPDYLSNTMHLYKEKVAHSSNISLEDLDYLDKIRD